MQLNSSYGEDCFVFSCTFELFELFLVSVLILSIRKMIIMLKKISFVTLSLFSLAFSATTHAAVSTIENGLSLPALTPQSGFEFNIAALWLKPGASNLNYAILNKELPTQSPSWHEQELQPSFTPAFALGVRFILPNMPGQDIKLDWTHLSSSTSDSVAAPDSSYFVGPDYQIGPDALPIRNATGKVKFKYDVVNLAVGQTINVAQMQWRFFGGISGASLREELSEVYSGNSFPPFPGPFSMAQNSTSKFNGIGPLIGVNVAYDTCYGIGLLGEATMSGLIGTMQSNTNFIGSAPELLALFGQTTNYQTITDQNVYQVIPGFSGKLGIDYKYAFNNVILSASAGYQAAVYINAISQYQPSSLVLGEGLSTGGIFVDTMAHRLSNYSVQGPFLNIGLIF